eukprot:TRINITY_DN26656_c0_g1_i1.p1 TRINITY_DN26656_c0_g1~~TRINITY_DN26656_c0_g1_i1.p1  ORF type:complete len:101 (+),score=16.72 TRINITY_DN26656_c0_g1_i1:294-596(+)
MYYRPVEVSKARNFIFAPLAGGDFHRLGVRYIDRLEPIRGRYFPHISRRIASLTSRECNIDIFLRVVPTIRPVSYTHLRAHETVLDLVCRLLLEKKKKKN